MIRNNSRYDVYSCPSPCSHLMHESVVPTLPTFVFEANVCDVDARTVIFPEKKLRRSQRMLTIQKDDQTERDTARTTQKTR